MNFTLEELQDTIQLFSAHQCRFLTENCIVALENNNHESGCNMEVIGDEDDEISLIWSSNVKTAGYQEQKKYVEHGATAISFFVAHKFTDYKVLQEATIGTGFDYWLGYDSSHENYNPLNFISARLEVSGIFKETIQNSIKKRVNIKKNQTNPTDNLRLPAYISVVEFSKPKVFFAKK